MNDINFLMQLVDKNSVFKDWNILKHKYDLQNNLYFPWMQLLSDFYRIRKITLNKITSIATRL